MSMKENAAGVQPAADNVANGIFPTSYTGSAASSNNKLQLVLSRLEGVKARQGGRYAARCPAHDDKTASLSVSRGDKCVLVHCFAGCAPDVILGAINMTLADTYYEPATPTPAARQRSRIVATYDYRDETGRLLYQVVRYAPKDFRQRRPDINGGWVWNLTMIRRVLYRLPELIAADPAATIWIVEGEKDVEAARELGLVATCSVGGAGKWREEYNAHLQGREIVIIPDNDQPGIDHAHAVAGQLREVATSIKVLTLPGIPDKGDLSDWLAIDGNDPERLCVLADGAPEWTPPAPSAEALHKQAIERWRRGAGGESGDTATASPRPAIEPISHNAVLREILHQLEQRERIDLAVEADLRYGKKVDTGEKMLQRDRRIVAIDCLLEAVRDIGFRLAKHQGDFVFIYNGAYWKEADRAAMISFLGHAAVKVGIPSLEARDFKFKRDLYQQLTEDCFMEKLDPPDDTVCVNLLNGTFEIGRDSQRLREFRAEDFLTHQLAFEFDPSAQAPRFGAYLNRVLPDPALQAILAEFFGYCFTRNLKLEKALLLYGSGANGKSVMFDLMNALFGKENISNFSLSNLHEEHNRALIAHKLLNFGSEVNATGINPDMVKALISTEAQQARLKYSNSFTMENYAKLCFNCNTLPRDIEHSHAWFRRLLIVPFTVQIPEREQDKELARTIIRDELPGVFNWVLDGLRRILQNRNFTHSDAVDQQIEEYKLESDTVRLFTEEEPENAEGWLKSVYSKYRSHSLESGHKPLGKLNFAKRMRSIGYRIEKYGSQGMYVSKDNPDSRENVL